MIVVKAVCTTPEGREIRRLPMSRLPGELTYDELCIMLHRLFKKSLSANIDNLVLKYIDEDGDLVCLESDIDISHALSMNSVLRVNVYDKAVLPVPNTTNTLNTLMKDLSISITPNNLTTLKSAFVDIRDKIDVILKTLTVDAEVSGSGPGGFGGI
ncbi:hypothetical protein HK102_008244 [Quaeritorhiza haematococci]|nr:hypothetical protein HK102_008244 [Quaeritorhiza haematococci]